MQAGCGLVVFLAGAAVALLLVGVFISATRSERRRSSTQRSRAAARLGGRYVPGSWFRRARIEFDPHGIPGRIHFPAEIEAGRNLTEAVLDFRGHSPGILKIHEAGFATGLARRFGGQDLEVGDPDFDARYVVKANPPSLASRFFAPERRPIILASFRRLASSGPPQIDLSREMLTVRVHAPLQDADAIVELGRTAETLTEYLLEVRPVVEFIWVEEPEQAGGLCQVCGTELLDRVVHCRRCRTPHHRECWEYAGRCSTFACTGDRFVAGKAEPEPPPAPPAPKWRSILPPPDPISDDIDLLSAFEKRKREKRDRD